jgi:hypothetical protein
VRSLSRLPYALGIGGNVANGGIELGKENLKGHL